MALGGGALPRDGPQHQTSRTRLLTAASFFIVGATVDLAAGFGTSIIDLSDRYFAATSDAQRAAYLAAAQSILATGNVTGFLVIFLTSVGIIMEGSVMLKGIFAKWTAYLGMAAGIVGIVWSLGAPFLGALIPLIIVDFLLLAVWFLSVGWKLCQLAG